MKLSSSAVYLRNVRQFCQNQNSLSLGNNGVVQFIGSIRVEGAKSGDRVTRTVSRVAIQLMHL